MSALGVMKVTEVKEKKRKGKEAKEIIYKENEEGCFKIRMQRWLHAHSG